MDGLSPSPTGIKDPPFVLVGVSNRDKTPWPPYPLPSPPARAIQLTCFAVLGSGEGNSYSFLHHICEDLWFPVHPSALKVWGLFFSSSLACTAHFINSFMNTKINYPQYGHIYKYITWSVYTHSKNFYYPHTHLNLKENHTYICNLNVQEMSYF